MKKNSGITLMEVLMVVSIIVILAGLLIPAMTLVRKTANETKQKAELNTIEIAILAFKNDYGDYPPSYYDAVCPTALNDDYTGAQKLSEALCGWDMLGFHPDSVWRSNGKNCTGGDIYPPPPIQQPLSTADRLNLQARKGPYLDMTKINVFKISQLFNTFSPVNDSYIICDVFGVRNITSGNRNLKAGMPILYFKANTNSKDYSLTAGCTDCRDRIYDFTDNRDLIGLGKLTPDGSAYTTIEPTYVPTLNPGDNGIAFYNYINDPRASVNIQGWPQKADSYLLISAGADGEYGTRDDICNFEHP